MMTINNEKYFTEYEVSVVQELTNILSPKMKEMGWRDEESEYEIHKYIRNEVFDEFYDYLVELDYINSHATSISEADYYEHNTTDLETIDTFCDRKLNELGYEAKQDTPDKSFILVTDMFAHLYNELDAKMFEALEDTNYGCQAERSEFFCSIAQEVLHGWNGDDWSEIVEKGLALTRTRVEELIEEEQLKKAKFKKGDEVYYMYDGRVCRFIVGEPTLDDSRWITYNLYTREVSMGNLYVEEVWETYLHKTPEDCIKQIREQIEKNNFGV